MRTERFKIKWREFVKIMKAEYKNVFSDAGVVLVLVIALILYATVYSFAYKNEVLRDIPIAVVDMSNTSSSRQLTLTLNSAPNIDVKYGPASMEEAQELFYARKVYGIVYIPADYEQKLLKGGEQVKVGVYVDASYFLMYRQSYSDIATAVLSTGAKVNYVKLLAAGANDPQAQAIVQPVSFNARNLFNPYLGYGTFVMPAIIIVIIQQTLLIGLGMIGGTWREFGIYKKLITPGERRLSTVPIVLGKTVVYLSIYAVTIPYILGVHYRLFGFPMNGAFWDILQFVLPYVLACIFLGIASSTLFRYRENSLLFMLWTSIPALLLSGASIPKDAIPHWMYILGKILPSSSGVEGFFRLQTMGASFTDVIPEVTNLWILCAVYFVLACVGIRKVLDKEDIA